MNNFVDCISCKVIVFFFPSCLLLYQYEFYVPQAPLGSSVPSSYLAKVIKA